jgi:glucosylceramidase
MKGFTMNFVKYLICIMLLITMQDCITKKTQLSVQVYETSADGRKLKPLKKFEVIDKASVIQVFPDETFQTITGFGGSFTEASAYLMNKISKSNREKILEAYFGENGARYSLTRTHMNSCDFSLGHYSYDPVEGDKELKHFSVTEDKEDLIPLIKEALLKSKDGFRIIASPWTAPPWMKDNKDWRGGKLLPEYYNTWALYFKKYIEAYRAEGINIWGITVENEPLGNNNNWESMLFTPEEMTVFVKDHLGPELKSDINQVKILGYDQNRGEELKKWADILYGDKAALKYFDGIAVHWYASTYDVFAESLQYTHETAPDKLVIQTEACLDGLVPEWNNDNWYWSEEAKDWGWQWAPEKEKYLHPKYVPVYRYARDMIGCLNNWVNGWIDWNMVLDKQGGPNWFKNWCGAPVLVDPEKDEVYLTPVYYVMTHFSRFIRPGAKRIGFRNQDKDLMVTAAKNPDGSIAVVVLNQGSELKCFKLSLGEKSADISISGRALQTIVIN